MEPGGPGLPKQEVPEASGARGTFIAGEQPGDTSDFPGVSGRPQPCCPRQAELQCGTGVCHGATAGWPGACAPAPGRERGRVSPLTRALVAHPEGPSP